MPDRTAEEMVAAAPLERRSPWRNRMPLLSTLTDRNGENPITFDEREADNAYLRRQGAVHEWFSLSYASHLVIPRLVLQSMPLAWQEDFVAMLKDISQELGDDWHPEDGYSVQAKGFDGKYAENPMSNYRRGKMLRPKCYDEEATT